MQHYKDIWFSADIYRIPSMESWIMVLPSHTHKLANQDGRHISIELLLNAIKTVCYSFISERDL